MGIQAVYWDYDNTIVATADAHWKKHVTVLARHGIQLNEIFRTRVYENNGNQNWKWMRDELNLKVPEKEYLEEVDCEFQRYLCELEIRSGINELFELIRSLNIPQAIITNARKNSAQPVLDVKGITPFMQFILFKEDYEERKPHPAPYLQGLSKMEEILGYSLDPHRCIAIEDDPKGVESAHQAGTIVIHRKVNEKDADSPYAHYCCYHKENFIQIVKQLLLSKRLS